jgi:hypothetical protein
VYIVAFLPQIYNPHNVTGDPGDNITAVALDNLTVSGGLNVETWTFKV